MNKLVAFVAGLVAAGSVYASSSALDVASNAAYGDGWQNGDNGGSGFGAWVLSSGANHGFFQGSSAGNGDGDGDSNGDINTLGVSLGLWANSGETASATRPFTGGSLAIGDIFTISLDNGWINNGNSVGVGLQNASGENLWEWYFVGGDAAYSINQLGGPVSSLIGFSDEGMNLSFVLTDADSFSLGATVPVTGIASNYVGDLLNPAGGQAITQVRVFNFNAGSGGNYDAFVNSMGVVAVPEPTTAVMGAMGLVLVGLLRRRR